MFALFAVQADYRPRRRAAKALYLRHGAEKTPEGRSLQLLHRWLSSAQRTQYAQRGYFEVIGGETGNRYRIYTGAATNVCEIGENGRPKVGLCFLPRGNLPIGDVMLAQKIALENCEGSALAVARKFAPNGFLFSRSRPLR